MTPMQFVESHGLVVNNLRADARWHRVPTIDKPKKRNGAYMYDGEAVVVQNWGTMANAVVLREGKATQHTATVKPQRVRAESDGYADASRRAQDELKAAKFDAHPYLARKGFPEEKGAVDALGNLLIPMRDFAHYGQVNSLQRIAPDGTKKFLSGGRAKGSVFILERNRSAVERWFCEGYATGLSIRGALRSLYRKAEIVVCFSAGNMQHVAAGQTGFVFADNDTSETGQKTAQAIGLPWLMSDVVGEDANDVQARLGLAGLASMMREFYRRQ